MAVSRLVLLLLLSSHLAAAIPCSEGLPWVHDGEDIDLFRAVPRRDNEPHIVGQVATVGFWLEYLDAGGSDNPPSGATNEWTPLRWDQLVDYHGAKVHINIMSADGDDFFHVHPEFTTFAVSDGLTQLGVDVTFLQPGIHLVTATWVVEASALHLCTIENIKHAHGLADNSKLYPLLVASWTVEVVEAAVASPSMKLDPAQVLHTSSQTTVSCGKPAVEALPGTWVYNRSYELHEAVTCCCSASAAAHIDAHLTQCTNRCIAGTSCVRVTAEATSLLATPGSPDTQVSTTADGTTLFPVGQCMAVRLDVHDATSGEPLELAPYLGAAAHVYIAPVDIGDASLTSLTTHAHAYDTLDTSSLSHLSKLLCEDVERTGVYPISGVPDSFTAPVHALVALPSTGEWRVVFSFRRGETLVSAAFTWATHGSGGSGAGSGDGEKCPLLNDDPVAQGPCSQLRHDATNAEQAKRFGCWLRSADECAQVATEGFNPSMSLMDCCDAIAPYDGGDCSVGSTGDANRTAGPQAAGSGSGTDDSGAGGDSGGDGPWMGGLGYALAALAGLAVGALGMWQRQRRGSNTKPVQEVVLSSPVGSLSSPSGARASGGQDMHA